MLVQNSWTVPAEIVGGCSVGGFGAAGSGTVNEISFDTALPLAEGTILDPFMGSGSTIAAAVACGLQGIGLEVNEEYYQMAVNAVPQLARQPLRACG